MEQDDPCPDRASRCDGVIEVPLDRADPEAGSIEVGFSFVPAASGASVGTIVGFGGGPGFANPVEPWLEALAPLTGRYDVLTVDYRGTGRSSHLYCPLPLHSDVALAASEVALCADTLGPDAELYGTVPAADDVEDVRAALGLDRLDVVGQSYGTYAAQVYAARHPDAVRTLSLDGPQSLRTSTLGLDAAAVAWSSVLIGRACQAADSPCAGTGDPRAVWTGAVEAARTGQTPWTLDELAVVLLRGAAAFEPDRLVAAAAASLAGELEPLQQMIDEYAVPELDPAELTPPAELTDISVAVGLVAICSDYETGLTSGAAPAVRADELEAAAAALPAGPFEPLTVAEYAAMEYGFLFARQCIGWTAPTARPDLAIPAAAEVPAVPTLVLVGERDLATPPNEAGAVAAALASATLLVFPGLDHVVTAQDACARDVLAAFIEAGAVPEERCGAASTAQP